MLEIYREMMKELLSLFKEDNVPVLSTEEKESIHGKFPSYLLRFFFNLKQLAISSPEKN